MKQAIIPSRPVVPGKFRDQDAAYQSIIQGIAFLLANDQSAIGWRNGGMGGGYYIDPDDESLGTHRPDEIYYLTPPEQDPSGLADYMQTLWLISPQDARRVIDDLNSDEDYESYEPQFKYLFTTKDAARNWLNDQFETEQETTDLLEELRA